jgi:hypothetical protein
MKNNGKKNKQSKELKFLINRLERARNLIDGGFGFIALGIIETLIDLLKED